MPRSMVEWMIPLRSRASACRTRVSTAGVFGAMREPSAPPHDCAEVRHQRLAEAAPDRPADQTSSSTSEQAAGRATRAFGEATPRGSGLWHIGRRALPWACVFLMFLMSWSAAQAIQVAAAPPLVRLTTDQELRLVCAGDGIPPTELPTETQRVKEAIQARCQSAGLPNGDVPVLANG
jgi:hypothetical protein